MAVADDNLLYVHPDDWDESRSCLMRTQASPFLDPMAALDRFDWSKPLTIAELGARFCRTFSFDMVSLPGA